MSTATVYRLCEAGELASVRVSHAIRVSTTDVQAFVEKAKLARDR